MSAILKYPLEVTDEQDIWMPAHAAILYVDVQNGAICLWAQVDRGEEQVQRRILIVGTGNWCPEPEEATYVGSVQMPPFVWHVFDGYEPCIDCGRVHR